MTALTLKSYQQAALDALAAFAGAAQMKGPARAFGELAGRPYTAEPFGEVPCVCLRIPTGGGKTVMAAHAVPLLARAWRATDAPVVVWLVSGQHWAASVFMAIWGMFVISGIDNIIKPYLISRGSQMPFVLVFLGVIGGIVAFGFLGVFLGPVLLAVGYTLLLAWNRGERIEGENATDAPAAEVAVDRSDAT